MMRIKHVSKYINNDDNKVKNTRCLSIQVCHVSMLTNYVMMYPIYVYIYMECYSLTYLML